MQEHVYHVLETNLRQSKENAITPSSDTLYNPPPLELGSPACDLPPMYQDIAELANEKVVCHKSNSERNKHLEGPS